MSHTMPGNPYETKATDFSGDASYRQINAILALAYERHTANLIELERLENERAVHGGLRVSTYGEIIRQRMDTRRYREGN